MEKKRTVEYQITTSRYQNISIYKYERKRVMGSFL